MSDIAARPDLSAGARWAAIPEALFVVTVFASAVLVFLVEPMMARLLLPLLGGSAAVWNTSLAFFQLALLAGYVYAHLLQKLARVGAQIAIHMGVLLVAALSLPLHVGELFGAPSSDQPVLWLLGTLTVSLGAPFAALSATAPLVQAWHARAIRHGHTREPYALYAASNLGSLLALVAYPALVEPNVRLHAQTAAWSGFYLGFAVLAALLGLCVWRVARAPALEKPMPASAAASDAASDFVSPMQERLVWLALAAAPSSLMLGVTNFITTELGSAPFLWVVPLALYLLTFVIAFSRRQIVARETVVTVQTAILILCTLRFWVPSSLPELVLHLVCFFLTALVCHQALVARRPPPERLTDFYIWISLGGVVGGAFNAFLAPLIFDRVIEYPAVLVLACLARPSTQPPVGRRRGVMIGAALGLSIAAASIVAYTGQRDGIYLPVMVAAFALAGSCAILLRGRTVPFAAVIFTLLTAGYLIFMAHGVLRTWRDFFGVLSLSRQHSAELGDVNVLQHGTTLHGAQSLLSAYRCRPLLYYAPETPIGQAFAAVEGGKPKINAAAVGLGTGSVAAYVRGADALRFFEIDPAVIRVASDPAYFSYTTQCARGPVAFTLGDARLKLAEIPSGSYDLLLVDAFSSDSVPSHLMTVEAMRLYLSKLKTDGILILHLSNRHLDLMRPAMAAVAAAGGHFVQQTFIAAKGVDRFKVTSEQVVAAAKSQAALEPLLARGGWRGADAGGVKPWTDDYVDILGALIRRYRDNQAALRHPGPVVSHGP